MPHQQNTYTILTSPLGIIRLENLAGTTYKARNIRSLVNSVDQAWALLHDFCRGRLTFQVSPAEQVPTSDNRGEKAVRRLTLLSLVLEMRLNQTLSPTCSISVFMHKGWQLEVRCAYGSEHD